MPMYFQKVTFIICFVLVSHAILYKDFYDLYKNDNIAFGFIGGTVLSSPIKGKYCVSCTHWQYNCRDCPKIICDYGIALIEHAKGNFPIPTSVQCFDWKNSMENSTDVKNIIDKWYSGKCGKFYPQLPILEYDDVFGLDCTC